MSDIKLIETGSGGDIVLTENDIEMVSGVENMPYIGLFGGNEQSTKEFNEGEERLDYWGNRLFLLQNKKAQFNSTLEKLLKNVALNSSSRLLIEDAIKKDLSFMSDFSVVDVETFIRSTDRIEIKVKISQSGSVDISLFNFLWDIKEEKLTPVISNGPTISNIVYLPLEINETKNIIITGTNYTPTTTVVIEKGLNTITVNNVTFDSSSQLTVNITTALVTGGFDVTVDNGISVTLVDGITVSALAAYRIVTDSFNKDNIMFTNTLPAIRSFHFKFTLLNSITAVSPDFTIISRYTNNIVTNATERIDVSFFSGVLHFGVWDSGVNQSLFSNSNSWNAGQEYDVHWVSDLTGGRKLYIDGILQINTNASTNAIVGSTGNIFFGGNIIGNVRHMDVKLREITLWSVNRTPAEIITDITTSPDGTEPNLIAYYGQAEGSGINIDSIPLPSLPGTLQTSNAGGPTYIDANMWELI